MGMTTLNTIMQMTRGALCGVVIALAALHVDVAADAARDRHAPCPGAAEAVAPRVEVVRVYNQSRLTDASVAAILQSANRLWLPYGVVLEQGTTADAIAVIIRAAPARPDGKTGRMTLGTTLFTEGHATPYIQLSLSAAEQVAADAGTQGDGFLARPGVQRDAVLLRMLGVALAHELGHYLLDFSGHSSDGLLKLSLRARDFEYPDPARLSLTGEQQALLCRAAVAKEIR